jgi:hypothetical protein
LVLTYFFVVKWDELVDAERTLEKHSARYRAWYGKKVTLIIDGFDLLAKSDAGLVAYDDLLDWARFLANKGDITVVFVASEGRAILKAVRASEMPRSTKLRSDLLCVCSTENGAKARLRAVEVHDESDAAGIAFLEKLLLSKSISASEQRELSQLISRLVHEVTGGRPHLLTGAADQVKKGVHYDSTSSSTCYGWLTSRRAPAILQSALYEAHAQLSGAKAAHVSAPPFIAAVSQVLLENGEISRSWVDKIAADVMSLTEADDIEALVDAVLCCNVFAIHPTTRMVTFQSPPMRTLMRNKLAETRSVSLP